MKIRTVGLLLAAVLASTLVCLAAGEVYMGTWKLNEAKSKIPAGGGKNTSVTYTMAGDQVKCTVDGVDAQGHATHNEWIGQLDGKDYAVTGDPTEDMRSYHKINGRTFTVTEKKNGKVTETLHIVFAADGKSRTVTSSTTDAKGNKVMAMTVYDKQ